MMSGRGKYKRLWRDEQIAQKVKDFYFYHACNRHKMTTLTPSYHAENYSPDDNRFDLRPFLQNVRFDAQFAAIDAAVAGLRQGEKGRGGAVCVTGSLNTVSRAVAWGKARGYVLDK